MKRETVRPFGLERPYGFPFALSRLTDMHLLIIPSEEFMPPHNKLDGIFQYHQAMILKNAGHRVGLLSVKLNFSAPMILKGLLFKSLGRKTGNATDEQGWKDLFRLGYNRLFHPKKFIAKDDVDGLTVYRIEALYRRPPQNLKNHISWVKAGLLCFEEYIKKEGRPDVIHAHNAVYAGLLAAEINRKYNLPFVLTEHSSIYALGEADDSVKARAGEAYAKAKGLFAVSESFAGYLNKLYRFNRFRCLPNVLDQRLENHPFQPVQKEGGGFTFLHVASLIDVKDQNTLLNAFKKLTVKREAVQLWIGGGGELEDALKAQVQSLGLQDCVTFLGLLNREEVISRLQACDAFVLSSKYETFGVVVIEAMLFGKPVIVTKVGVGQDIVNEKTGYVVETGNATQLAEAMLKMSLNKGAYDANFIRRYVIDNFGKDAFLSQIETVYNDAAQRPALTAQRQKESLSV